MTTTPTAPKSDRAFAPKLRRAAPTEAAGYAAFAESVFGNTEGQEIGRAHV